MTVKMKALKSFTGKPGEGENGGTYVRQGSIFDAENKRAQQLQANGLAAPMPGARKAEGAAPANKAAKPEANKKTQDPTGGLKDGTAALSSSSAPAPAPKRAAPRSGKGKPKASAAS